jgi:hypothetical protein
MALDTTSFFAAFDVTDGSQTRDISPILTKALLYDLNLLGAINVDFGSPAQDTTHYWNDDVLNTEIVALSTASVASTGTLLTVATGHGAHIGDLLKPILSGNQEILQITATDTSLLTVTRTYNSTVAASLASTASLALIRAEQEGSDIGTDRTKNVNVLTNFTQIFSTYDLAVTGSQLERKMATTELADFFAHQLANRAIEMKTNLSRATLYSEKSSSAGSDTVYRTFAGLRNWSRGSGGVTNSLASALSYTILNSDNTTVANLGCFLDTLVIGTDLVGSVAAIDNSVRRLRESDTQVGYTVQEILLNQGNLVKVVVDSRVSTGDYFMFDSQKIRLIPFGGRGMFVKQAPELKDAKRARILGEWTLEARHPSTIVNGHSKT